MLHSGSLFSRDARFVCNAALRLLTFGPRISALSLLPNYTLGLALPYLSDQIHSPLPIDFPGNTSQHAQKMYHKQLQINIAICWYF